MEAPAKRKYRKTGHPTTSEKNYSSDRTIFLKAVDSWKRETGVKFPTHTQILDIAESCGWKKVD